MLMMTLNLNWLEAAATAVHAKLYECESFLVCYMLCCYNWEITIDFVNALLLLLAIEDKKLASSVMWLMMYR